MPSLSNKKIKILLIEDEVISQRVLKLILENICECSVEQADDLQSALSHLEIIYDIIFTDINLPDGNAVTFIEQYHKKHATVPLVAISAYIPDEEKILNAGAVEVIRKPASAHLLKELIEILVSK